MTKYIDKSTLVAEIKKYIANYTAISVGIDKKGEDWVDSVSMLNAKIDTLQSVLSLLDIIETKEVDEEYNGKAMLHVLEKGVEQGRRELIDKACKWLKKWDAYRVCLEGSKD